MNCAKIAFIFLFLSLTFQQSFAAEGFSANIIAPEKLQVNAWNEVSVKFSTPNELKNVKFYMALSDDFQTKIVNAAQGRFEHAFNAIRMEWEQLKAGQEHTIVFKVFIPSAFKDMLRLHGIFSFANLGNAIKIDTNVLMLKSE